MQAEIKKASQAKEYFTDERCFITEIANDPDDHSVSIAKARVHPEVTTAWHRLEGVAERYLIISGTGVAEVGDLEPEAVTSGDVIKIPAGVRQRITNTGADDLIFYAVCTPRFIPECYIALEENIG